MYSKWSFRWREKQGHKNEGYLALVLPVHMSESVRIPNTHLLAVLSARRLSLTTVISSGSE